MTDVLDQIRDHYGVVGLAARLKAALAGLAPEEQRLTARQLAPVDQFHTRGYPATLELAKLADLTAASLVLDIGSGIGGPARVLAETCGCRVTGVDISEPFVEAARYLNRRTGQEGQVSFAVASALDLPFGDAEFDVVLLQHVAMNIAERARLYSGIWRVLKPGGRFATYDIVSNGAEPHYPEPWARSPETSFLLTAAATREAVECAGFRTLSWQDDTPLARAWIAELGASGPPASPNLGIVMGSGFGDALGNLGRSLVEGRIGVLTAVFEAVSQEFRPCPRQ
jgi:sarcosine/dimethylglycine N-methyltransferase